MSKYDVTDEMVIKATPEEVCSAIIGCYNGTNNWWMPYLSSTVIHGGSSDKVNGICKVTLHELVPVKFITKTSKVFINERLHVIYTKGAFVGEGIWLFEKIDDKTKISFRWQASPSGFFMKTLSLFYPLQKRHSVVMQKGFVHLKKLLEGNIL